LDAPTISARVEQAGRNRVLGHGVTALELSEERLQSVRGSSCGRVDVWACNRVDVRRRSSCSDVYTSPRTLHAAKPPNNREPHLRPTTSDRPRRNVDVLHHDVHLRRESEM